MKKVVDFTYPFLLVLKKGSLLVHTYKISCYKTSTMIYLIIIINTHKRNRKKKTFKFVTSKLHEWYIHAYLSDCPFLFSFFGFPLNIVHLADKRGGPMYMSLDDETFGLRKK